ncbi:hypothetical protein [Kitasatospora terrestris]|uniref:Uncharacterized protein n=1 Tax=Kitasatospora terrestris TaxID=258051 RepID=A0ABP9E507_9ACTN
MSANSLPAAAALHGFLTQHTELQAFPISWVLSGRDGVGGGLPAHDPDIRRVAKLFAAALGVEVTGSVFDLRENERVLGRFVHGQVGGVEIFFGAYASVEDGDL